MAARIHRMPGPSRNGWRRSLRTIGLRRRRRSLVWAQKVPRLRTQHLKRSILVAAVFGELGESFFNAVRAASLRHRSRRLRSVGLAQEAEGARLVFCLTSLWIAWSATVFAQGEREVARGEGTCAPRSLSTEDMLTSVGDWRGIHLRRRTDRLWKSWAGLGTCSQSCAISNSCPNEPHRSWT